MTPTAQAVLEKALRLDAVERARLIDALLKSFGHKDTAGTDAARAREVESRIDACDAGTLDAAPVATVMERLGKR